MSLLALVCPECASALPAARERRVLVCASCGRSWSVPDEDGPLTRLQRILVRPQCPAPSGAEIVLLPVWLVCLRVGQMPRVPASMPTEIRIPAIGVQRLPLLVNFARNLTRAPLRWEPWEGVAIAPEPAELTPADAYTLAETVVLRHVDGWPDDARLPDLEIPFGAARLVDWPCARFGSELIELVGGISAQRALTEGALLGDRQAELRGPLRQLQVGMPR